MAFPVIDQGRQPWEDPGVREVILPDSDSGTENDSRERRFVDKVEKGEKMVPPMP